MLFTLWGGDPHRPTKDLDLLGYGDSSFEYIRAVFKSLCEILLPEDGLYLDVETIQVERIKPGQKYEGVRVSLKAYLARAVIPIQIDVGFGDAILPAQEIPLFTPILDMERPQILTYPPESVIAEKYHAMVILEMGNSRMKDFYDIAFMSQKQSFEFQRLSQAILLTFTARETPVLDSLPFVFTPDFYDFPPKVMQWNAFLKKNKLTAMPFIDTVQRIQQFLWPVHSVLGKAHPVVISGRWAPEHSVWQTETSCSS